MSRIKASIRDSDEEDEQTFQISQVEKDEIDKLGDDNDDSTQDSMDFEDTPQDTNHEPHTHSKSTSKYSKDNIDSTKSSHPHQRSQVFNNLEAELRRQKNKLHITRDELRVSTMKRELLLSEITYCSTTADIINLKKKYNLPTS